MIKDVADRSFRLSKLRKLATKTANGDKNNRLWTRIQRLNDHSGTCKYMAHELYEEVLLKVFPH